MKDLIRKIQKKFYKFIFYFFSIKFNLISKKNPKIIIFDLDNTLANTWPSFLEGFESESLRLMSVKPFKNVLELVNSYIESEEKIVFLTARDYRHYFLTKKWLKQYINGPFSLILVSKPDQKVKLLGNNLKNSFVYYDDLSYSHEHGKVKFYSDQIAELMTMSNVKYYGYYEILKIQGILHEKNKASF